MPNAEHEFGGDHTEIKLDMLRQYLQAYTIALNNKFKGDLWYIDAFAGTGSRTVKTAAKAADLLSDAQPERIETRQGSARIALDTNPQFSRLVFMDARRSHCSALEALAREYPHRNISVKHGDANRLIQSQIAWPGWRKTRAVLFLDPYGMEVEWDTLKAIAATGAIDVWYLFSLEGLYRQAARNISAVDAGKRESLTRLLGTDAWENELYSSVKQSADLLGQLDTPETRQRHADVAGLERYVQQRLRTIFAEVLDPFPLPLTRKPQRFSLFFAVSNPSPRAISLATRFGSHILASGRLSQVRP